VAESIEDLYVVLAGDPAPLLAAFVQVTAAGEEMAAAVTASLAEVKAAMAESMAGVGAGAADSAGIAALGTEAETAAAEVASAATEMDASLAGVGEAAAAMGTEFDATLAGMQAQIAATEASLAAVGDETAAMSAKMATDNAALTASATEAGAATAGVGEAMAGTAASASSANTSLGMSNNALLALGAAAIGAGYESVKMAGDFQQSITKLQTSANESAANLQMVSNGILSMAGQVGYSAQDLANAMYMVESSGQHGADALKVLQASAQGAKTENADLTTVVNAVTDAMTDYHMSADQAATVTSKLVQATADGKTSFQDLSGAMSAILPKASAAHVSLDDILGDLSSMTEHGESAQQSAENLADALSHMAAPTAAQSKELAALGINSTQLSQSLGQQGLSGAVNEVASAIQNQMGPQGQVIINLQNALKGLPPAVQATGEAVLEGTESWSQWNASTKDLPEVQKAQASSFATLANSMHTIGTQSLSTSQIMQTYTGAMQKAMGTSAGLNVALMLTGENASTTAGDIKNISGATADASGNVQGWTEVQGNFNQKIDEAKSAFGAMAISVGEKLLPVLSVFAGIIADVFNFLAAHQSIAVALATILGVVLVAALGALIAKFALWIANSAAGFVMDIAKGAVWVATKIAQFAGVGAAADAEAAEEAVAAEAGDARKLASALGSGAVWVATKIAQGVAVAASAVAQGVVASAAWVASEVKTLASATTTGAVWVATKIAQGVAAAASAVVQGAAAAAAWVASNAAMLASQLSEGAVWLATWIAQGVAAAASSVVEAAIAAGAWIAANAAIILATGGVILIIGAVIAIIYELIQHWQDVKAAAQDVWGAVTSAVSSMYNAVSGMIGNLIGMFSNAASWLVNAGYNIVVGLWNGIASGWSWLEGQVSSLASSLLSTAKSALGISSPSKAFADEVGAWISPGIAQGIDQTASQAVGAVQSLSTRLVSAAAGGAGLDMTVGATTPGGGLPFQAAVGGSAGAAGGINVQVNVQGHVWQTQDLVAAIQQQLLRHNIRNSSNATSYAFG
jgi:TP901 family phage tail tape measure protein